MSAVAPKPTSVVTVAMPSSASPRPAASSGSRSGTTSALGSTCPARRRFLASPRLSDAAASRLDGHRFPGFCPGYRVADLQPVRSQYPLGTEPLLVARPCQPELQFDLGIDRV